MNTQLKVSHVVNGRKVIGNRVYYIVDPAGAGDELAVPETVVLRRWRRRIQPGYRFDGARLSSTFWRALVLTFRSDAERMCRLTLDQIQAAKDRHHAALVAHHYKLPSARHLKAIFIILGPEKLQTLIDRHHSLSHDGHFGTPDLFLYAVEQLLDRPCKHRFVEVKKPGEKNQPGPEGGD
jgi:hypothetical protein